MSSAVEPKGLRDVRSEASVGGARLATLLARHRMTLVTLLIAVTVAGAAGFGYLQARHLDEDLRPQSVVGAAAQADPAASEVAWTLNDATRSMALAGNDRAEGQTAKGVPWPLWEFQLREPIPPREQALTPLPWRLIGASGLNGKWQLIVLRQGKNEPEYFRVGDKLPGNYRIEAISEEDVTLKHGRRALVLSYIASR